MRKIIKLVTGSQINAEYLLIDGQNPVFEYKDRQYIAYIETEKEKVNIKMEDFHPYFVKNWWIKEILFFMVSIFGIFDARKFTHQRRYKYEAEVTLHEGENLIIFNNDPSNTHQFKLDGPTEVETKVNEIYIDKQVKRRNNGLIWSKIGVFLLLTGLLALILIFTLK